MTDQEPTIITQNVNDANSGRRCHWGAEKRTLAYALGKSGRLPGGDDIRIRILRTEEKRDTLPVKVSLQYFPFQDLTSYLAKGPYC